MAANRAQLITEVRIKLTKLELACDALSHPIALVSGFRTLQEQDVLYAQGRTRPGKIVTNAIGGRSWHNFGRAFDVAWNVKGGLSWEGPWDMLGLMGEALELTWGGRFAAKDVGHFEYHPNLTLAQASAEYEEKLKCRQE
jgi:peptidoglycan L-alanyl-D-glutamate endopeptidase CwlK